MIAAPNELEVITLFVEDLPAAKTFYTNVFGLEMISEDNESAVLKLKNAAINLLVVGEAHEADRAGLRSHRRHRHPRAANHQRQGHKCGRLRTRAPRCEADQRPGGPAVGPTHRRLRRPGRSHLGDRTRTARGVAEAKPSSITEFRPGHYSFTTLPPSGGPQQYEPTAGAENRIEIGCCAER